MPAIDEIRDGLIRRGFRLVRRNERAAVYAKIGERKLAGEDWMFGAAVVLSPLGAVKVAAAVPMAEARVEAIGCMMGELESIGYEVVEVGRRRGRLRRVLRRMGKKFRRKVNKAAGKIAKMKVMKKLRAAYAKVLQSPIAGAAVKAAATALNAFGVPKAVTTMALNQARFATIDRMKQGGWAGVIERGTGKEGLKGLLKEAAKRHGKAALKAAKTAIPIPGLAKVLETRGVGQPIERVCLGCIEPEGPATGVGYDNAYLRGWYGV